MADTSPLPLTAAATTSSPPGPGIATVLRAMVKDGAGLALVGALVGIAAAAVLTVIIGPSEVVSLISRNFFKLNTGGPILSSLTSGAALGALSGAAIGIPAGGVEGINEIQNYYNDVAIPQTARQAEAHGIEIGADLEHKALAHEAESRKYRDLLAQLREQSANVEQQPIGRT